MRNKTLQCLFVPLILGGVAFASTASGAVTTKPSFKTMHLLPSYCSDGANIADLNKDGNIDVICGPHWWVGPNFKKR